MVCSHALTRTLASDSDEEKDEDDDGNYDAAATETAKTIDRHENMEDDENGQVEGSMLCYKTRVSRTLASNHCFSYFPVAFHHHHSPQNHVSRPEIPLARALSFLRENDGD
jgi:hypothetical protein